jgi:dihydroorotate dehydrogenase
MRKSVSYKTFIRPALFQFDPEFIHEQVTGIGGFLDFSPTVLSVLNQLYCPPVDDRLKQTILNSEFQNPIGIAAGFDKNVQLTKVLHSIGFGFEEVGSISAKPWKGNPKPRLFRLAEDKAVINRMGLNNHGVDALRHRIRKLPENWPVGISLVKTPDPTILGEDALADFARAFEVVYGLGSYVSINISCPNTEEGKTFEEPESLDLLLSTLREAEWECQTESRNSPRPWLLKISPDLDLSQVEELYAVGKQFGISGWVACNTTSGRDGLKTPQYVVEQCGRGGLSGIPVRDRSTKVLAHLYQLGKGLDGMVLIGVGGIHNVDSAWEKITHGASLIQLYTGLIYEGPELLKTIHAGLIEKLEQHGYAHIKEAVGSAFR